MKLQSYHLWKKISVATIMSIALFNVNTKVTHAATITLPQGYTVKRIERASYHLTPSLSRTLAKISCNGWKHNNYKASRYDNSRIVNVNKLTASEKSELAHFSLNTINNARRQFNHKPWHYSKAAMHFADRVARNYYQDGTSCWDPDHDVKAITKAAKVSGLNYRLGQVYEDEAALPITTQYHEQYRSMGALKEQLYFNIKQMLFGNYAGDNVNDLSNYVEYKHAGDLLGCRIYDVQTKYFGQSFSLEKGNSSHISVHMLTVDPRLIQNYRKFK